MSKFDLDRMERLPLAWPDYDKMSMDGVMTGATADYWPTLRLLAYACREARTDLAVWDFGLTDSQRAALLGMGRVWISKNYRTYARSLAEIEADRGNVGIRVSETWLKPMLCVDSPFRTTVWIDADAVPIRGLYRLMERAAEGPFLTADSFVSPQYAYDTYVPLLQALYGRVPENYERVYRCNTGVFGFHSAAPFLEQWERTGRDIAGWPNLARLCGLGDQAMLVAMMSILPDMAPPMIEDPAWNCPANGLQIENRKHRVRYRMDQPVEAVFDALRYDHRRALVVHWMGHPKPWHD